MPELASASGTAPTAARSLQGACFREKTNKKMDGLLWIPVPSGNLQLPVLTEAQLPSVCVSLELQPVAQKIPEAFGVGAPSFCGSVAQKLGSFGVT